MTEIIRLCTWNIQLGWQLETVLDAIKTQNDFQEIDLLALQECSMHSDQEDACQIARALGPEYQSYQVTAQLLSGMAQANALVWNSTRFHLSSATTFQLPRARESKLSRVERTLLYALPQQQRMCIVMDGQLGAESLRVYVAHLDLFGLTHKWEQFNRILTDANTRQPPVNLSIITGDLNTFRIRSRPSWTRIAATAQQEHFEDLTTEIRWTHHTLRRARFRQKLDAIFVQRSQPFTYRSWSLDIPGSDHIPVFAEINW